MKKKRPPPPPARELRDFPLERIRRDWERIRELAPHAKFFQKWTCAHCGERNTARSEGVLFKSGTCASCRRESPIDKCGFILLLTGPGE
jgi:hypothetical protein